MTKKAPFFSHDMNARHDPKISAMRCEYGSEGYGWFWMLVEMMAEASEYQLDCRSKYTIGAYAMQLQCKTEIMQKFIEECITEFELFETDGMYFWSNSLRNRMRYRDAVSEKKAAAANKRWENQQNDAEAMHMHNISNADAMQKNANKTKQNETKQNETKKESIPFSEIIEYLNQQCGTKYKASGAKAQTLIKARWNEGFKIDDFKTVIDKKSAEWKGDKMESYLRPETLFGTKFESYLNQPNPSISEKRTSIHKPEKIIVTDEENDFLQKVIEGQRAMNAKNTVTT